MDADDRRAVMRQRALDEATTRGAAARRAAWTEVPPVLRPVRAAFPWRRYARAALGGIALGAGMVLVSVVVLLWWAS